ncbi:MAG TPA: hypothetical protein VN700_08190 [Vicinamibacterales bacterium]|nr:hypothetical protein [Vicinamibacterales bacterium]
MKRLVLLGVLLLLPLTVRMSAQAKTDFSGRWTTDPAPGATGPAGATGAGSAGAAGPAGQGRGGPARGDMGSGWGPTITITQTGAQLTVEYAFFGRGDMQPPLKFTYALDGSETKNSVMMGRGTQAQVSKTAWDGAKLVITTLHTLAGPDGKPMTAEVKQTLSLESPTSLAVDAVRAGVLGGPATTTRTVYRKL